jgi:hypothetical protein
MIRTYRHLVPAGLALAAWLALAGPAAADGPSTAAATGIHSQGLGLTGAGVRIGQVEPNRPGDPAVDNAANSNANVVPSATFIQQTQVTAGNGNANNNTSDHAEQVAGVMIAGAGGPTSVAPGATLFSAADVVAGPNNQTTAVTAQTIVNQGVRAINMSFGNPHPGGVPNDGSDTLSRFVDWSSAQHNILYVTAADEAGHVQQAPQDAFNRLNVGYTSVDGAGVFRQIDPGNRFTTTADGRTENDLVAPGGNITMPVRGAANPNAAASGTSFAAPHVTATVALLQQYGNTNFVKNIGDASRHEVMKAVLMNSADKFTQNGGATTLGMEKTILRTDGQDWLASHAATNGANDKTNPLDNQMGTGQLNAFRALNQYAAGEFHSTTATGNAVPRMGWDYGRTAGLGDNQIYAFDTPLGAGQWVSITLAWDHMISKDNTGGGNANTYAAGDV